VAKRVASRFAMRLFTAGGGGQRGSALLVVLVMLGLIAALASVVARSVSGAALAVGAARTAWQAEADLRAGVELGAATILKLGEDLRSAEAAVDLTNRRLEVRVTNERARIDLNAASAAVLARLLETNGVLEDEAAALATGVIAWREDPATQKLTAPPRDGSKPEATRHFLHPWQLGSVPGFSQSLVKAILPLVTVANGSDEVDPYVAADGVLNALPGASPSSVDAFVDARDGNTSREAAIQLLGVQKKLLTADPSLGWRIEIAVHMPDGRIRRSEAVIAILGGDREPYRVLYVLDDQGQPSPWGG
jgi:general secretion pathway protein K